MNYLSQKTVLVLYNAAYTNNTSTNLASPIVAAAVIDYAVTSSSGTVTLTDCQAKTEANVTTYIGTLVAGTYDYIFNLLMIEAASHGHKGSITGDQIASLIPYLKTAYQAGTTVVTGTAQAGAAHTITLAAASSAVNDTYNTDFVRIDSGTGIGQTKYVSDYVGASKVATVSDAVWSVNPDATSVYTVFTTSRLLSIEAYTALNHGTALQVWNTVYADNTPPKIVEYVSRNGYALASGTAQAIAAGTITLAAALTTGDRMTATEWLDDNALVGKYVYLYSATAAAVGEIGQIAKIKSWVASTKVCTLETVWGITPVGTSPIYRVVDTLNEAGKDAFIKLAVLSYLWDLTNGKTYNDYAAMFDMNGNLADLNEGAAGQDLTLLQSYSDKGQAIVQAISTSHTSIPAV